MNHYLKGIILFSLFIPAVISLRLGVKGLTSGDERHQIPIFGTDASISSRLPRMQRVLSKASLVTRAGAVQRYDSQPRRARRMSDTLHLDMERNSSDSFLATENDVSTPLYTKNISEYVKRSHQGIIKHLSYVKTRSHDFKRNLYDIENNSWYNKLGSMIANHSFPYDMSNHYLDMNSYDSNRIPKNTKRTHFITKNTPHPVKGKLVFIRSNVTHVTKTPVVYEALLGKQKKEDSFIGRRTTIRNLSILPRDRREAPGLGFQEPQHKDHRQNLTVVLAQVGRSATISCYTQYRGGVLVSWLRRDIGHIITVGNNVFSRSGRYELYHDDKEGLWQLTITNIRSSDEGMYECQLATNEKPESLFFNLTVKESRAIIRGPSELTVREGSRLKLNCTVVDALEPPKYIIWLLDGSIVPQMSARTTPYSKTLYVGKVDEEHTGLYSCDPYLAVPAYVRVRVIGGPYIGGGPPGNTRLDVGPFEEYDVGEDTDTMVDWPDVFAEDTSAAAFSIFGSAASATYYPVSWLLFLVLSVR